MHNPSKHEFRKWLALLLAVLTILPCLPALELSAEAASVYEIKDVAGLQYAVTHPDGDYILTKDIDLSAQKNWTPIGTVSTPFSGSFNGNGHTVKLAISGNSTTDDTLFGLFGAVSGEVKNLIVTGTVDVTCKRAAVGGIAAALIDGGEIFNCTSYVKITVKSSGQPLVGGIAGITLASAATVDGTVQYCRTAGSISATVSSTSGGSGNFGDGTNGAIGGMVGFSANSATTEVAYCKQEGTITVDGGSCNVGGMIGQSSVNGDTSITNIYSCANIGDITINNLKGERAAGIIGYVRAGEIVACYNTGNIIAYSDNGKTISRNGYGTYFGIFGYANMAESHKVDVLYCFNASPKALEAEICVVRNPSYATFKNFYMQGRTEYERDLNSGNVASGNAGTAFSSASDLWTKMSATDAKNYYVQDPDGGYPIHKWEIPRSLSAGDGFAAYLSTREGEDTVDVRFVLAATEAKLNAYSKIQLKVTFVGTNVTKTFTLGSDLKTYQSVTAKGQTYHAEAGSKLFGVVVTGAPYSGWTKVTAEVLGDGKTVYTGSVNYSALFTGGTPVSFAQYTDFKSLPDYPDGTAASTVYNAGPGNANDKTSTTSTDSKMLVISKTRLSSYNSYINTLVAAGYQKTSTNEVEGNYFATLTKGGSNYYIYYTAYNKQVRIILDKAGTLMADKIDSGKQGSGTTEFYQYALDHTEGTGTYSPDDYWKIDCGMCYIIKFADNSVMIVDGGHERQASKAAMEGLYDFLCDITNTASTSKLHIRGWFYSHAHGDHVYVGHQFVETYHDRITLDCTYFNFPSYQVISGGYDGNTFTMKDTLNKYFPNCGHVDLHTGQSFHIQGVQFDVLYTHEDAVNESGKTTIGDFNASSTVLKITFDGASVMMLGDISTVAENIMCSMYTEKTLHSTIVQAAHHCFNNLPTLYSKIAAPYAVIPGSEYNTVTGNANKLQGMLNAANNVQVYYADAKTYKFTATSGKITVTELPKYTEAFLIEIPAIPTYNGSTAAEPTVALSTVMAFTNLNDLVIDKSLQGTAGFKSEESPSRLLDGSTSTKFCTANSAAVISWTTKEAVSVKGYVLNTGNDTANNPDRNPKTWLFMGSVDGKTWIVLDEVYDADMPAANNADKAFLTDNDTACKYFALYIFAAEGGSGYNTGKMQFSELTMYGNK